MAEQKKSVVMYCDIIHTVEKLDNETAGLLFKHYLRYVNDLDPKTDSVLVDLVFEPIKQNLKRDLIRWNERKLKKSEIAVLANLKRWHPETYKKYEAKELTFQEALNESQNIVNDPEGSQTIPMIHVNVNDNVNVNVNDNVNVIKEDKEKIKRFLPPSTQEIFEFFKKKNINERIAHFESEKMFNHYESNGWLVGRNKMKNWNSAASGWITRMNAYTGNKNQPQTANGTAVKTKLQKYD
jgi:hypothetical protein